MDILGIVLVCVLLYFAYKYIIRNSPPPPSDAAPRGSASSTSPMSPVEEEKEGMRGPNNKDEELDVDFGLLNRKYLPSGNHTPPDLEEAKPKKSGLRGKKDSKTVRVSQRSGRKSKSSVRVEDVYQARLGQDELLEMEDVDFFNAIGVGESSPLTNRLDFEQDKEEQGFVNWLTGGLFG